jgi:hypothetical protein
MTRAIFILQSILLCAFLLPLKAGAQKRAPFIAFTSDTQEPMWVETLFLKPDQNLKATKMIFADVEAVHPAGFFILGDVVSLGYRTRAWHAVDSYIKQCTRDSIPVYATLGNHEVMFNKKRGIKNFQSRFPMYRAAGYTEIIDSVAVVLLNSNFAKMTATEISAQNDWYNGMIKSLDNDNAIKYIIVGCHHSPYTNSTIVKPSAAVRDNFVPAFIKSKKSVLFLSGHSHNFERFNVQGKCFLVIGGGGGLHQPLYAKALTKDISPDYKPSFHYLEVRRLHGSLQVISRKLKPDFSGFEDGLILSVK